MEVRDGREFCYFSWVDGFDLPFLDEVFSVPDLDADVNHLHLPSLLIEYKLILYFDM